LVNKKRKIMDHMDELQQTYFRMLKAKKQLFRATSGAHDVKGKDGGKDGGRPGMEGAAAEHKNDVAADVIDLDAFGKQLQKLVRFNGYGVIATIQEPSRGVVREGTGRGQGRAHASLVTSMEFDKEVRHPFIALRWSCFTPPGCAHSRLVMALRRDNILRWRATTSEFECSTIAPLSKVPERPIFLSMS
jgi:hypothetical protein